MKTMLVKTRKRLATKLQNPRLLKITFHTFRHWKATMLHHQTRDPYYVQRFLGHKSIKSTEVYINIEHTLFEAGANDEFTVKVAEKPEEIKTLLEVGFEYVCQEDNLAFLKKANDPKTNISSGRRLPKGGRGEVASAKVETSPHELTQTLFFSARAKMNPFF